MNSLHLILKSMRHRKTGVLITIASLALGLALLLGVERIRNEAENGFIQTLSGTDLIVGARSGSVSLLLSSVFHIGNVSDNVTWETYQKIDANPQVAWTIPLSLGDTHGGYAVLGTSNAYFEHYRYANKENLTFADGGELDGLYSCVLGAEVARTLGYSLGTQVVLSHGSGEISFVEHTENPFTVVGILNPTGTPVDQTVHVKLEGIEAIHRDFHHEGGDHSGCNHPSHRQDKQDHSGCNHPSHRKDETTSSIDGADSDTHQHSEECDHSEHEHSDRCSHAELAHSEECDHSESEACDHGEDQTHQHDESCKHEAQPPAKPTSNTAKSSGSAAPSAMSLDDFDQLLAPPAESIDYTPTEITAFLVGMHQRSDALQLQRAINQYNNEALTGVMPGIALTELWSVVAMVERVLFAISLCVLGISFANMLALLSMSLRERNREMAIMRSLGARPHHIFTLILGEALVLCTGALALGFAFLSISMLTLAPILQAQLGIQISIGSFNTADFNLILGTYLAGLTISVVPAWNCYRRSLSQGLSTKL